MIRNDKIQASLFGGVGFRNSTITGYDIVSVENQASASGLYFQDSSELVSVKNIKDCQENPSATTTQINTLLGTMQKSVISDVCAKVIAGKSDFIESVNLYPFSKSFERTIEHKDKFVGFEIEPVREGIICKIPWVELAFDSAVTFTIYLYNSNLPKSPIQSKEVTTTAGESKIVALDWYLSDDTTYKGGKFYLGYFDGDLGEAKAFKNDYNLAGFSVNAPYFNINQVSLDYDTTTIQLESVISESYNFGMNVGIDIYNDYTELVVRNKSLFWRAIQYQMHEKVLNLIKYSTRTNATELKSKDNISKIDFELYGNKEFGIVGVLGKLNKEIETLRKSLFFVPRITRKTLL